MTDIPDQREPHPEAMPQEPVFRTKWAVQVPCHDPTSVEFEISGFIDEGDGPELKTYVFAFSGLTAMDIGTAFRECGEMAVGHALEKELSDES